MRALTHVSYWAYEPVHSFILSRLLFMLVAIASHPAFDQLYRWGLI